MFTVGRFWRRLWFLLRRGRLERELQEEMRQHAALKTQKNLAAGMDPEEAHYAAQRQLGNMTRQQEESRSSWGFPLLDSLLQDVRYALRGLRKAPGFTTVAVLTLALGIGATTAIFSIVNAVLLRPLPYKNSNRLVLIWSVTSWLPQFSIGQSKPDFDDIKAQARSFEAMAMFKAERMVLTGEGEPEQIAAAAVSSGFLDLFSIQPVLGRGLQPGDEQLKNGNVVLLSHGLWQRRFAGNPNVIGKPMTLDGKPFSIAGVLPKGFTYPRETEIWVPLVIEGKGSLLRGSRMYTTLGRLRPSTSIRAAQAELDNIAGRLAREYPDDAGESFTLASLRETVVNGGTLPELAVLAGAVTFLLLIACANVSNLVLSRCTQRRREIAVRAALGATGGRILRQLLIESFLLAFGGGLAGLSLAAGLIGAFRFFAPSHFARFNEVHFEPSVAMIAFIVSSLAGVLCGLAPALRASRTDLTRGFKDCSAGLAGKQHRFSLRTTLVVSEVALALVLLTGSALLAQSLARMMKVDTGFRTDHLLTAEVYLPKSSYPSSSARRLFVQRISETLNAEPQFKGVAISNKGVLEGSLEAVVLEPGALGTTEKGIMLEASSVSAGFFKTMEIPVVAGRSFNANDTTGVPQVAIINQSLARRYFAGQSPVGKLLKLGPDPGDQYQIVGIAGDTRDVALQATARPQVFFPLLRDAPDSLYIVVRSSSDPLALAKLLQNSVWSVDKDLPVTKVSSMTQVIAQSVAEPRLRTWLFAAFATAGLTLTLIGIYGVISYSVSQRVQEIGVRMALGAQPQNVLRLVLGQGVRLALIGALLGLAGSVALMRLLVHQLYEIKPGDPVTLAGAALLMLVAALGASYVPARRATKVDPMAALRFE